MPSVQPGVLMPAVFVGACWLGIFVFNPALRPWLGRQHLMLACIASIGSVLNVVLVWLYDMTITSLRVGAK
jgi:hypothetical protein